jgi:hypothetical protein
VHSSKQHVCKQCFSMDLIFKATCQTIDQVDYSSCSSLTPSAGQPARVSPLFVQVGQLGLRGRTSSAVLLNCSMFMTYEVCSCHFGSCGCHKPRQLTAACTLMPQKRAPGIDSVLTLTALAGQLPGHYPSARCCVLLMALQEGPTAAPVTAGAVVGASWPLLTR